MWRGRDFVGVEVFDKRAFLFIAREYRVVTLYLERGLIFGVLGKSGRTTKQHTCSFSSISGILMAAIEAACFSA